MLPLGWYQRRLSRKPGLHPYCMSTNNLYLMVSVDIHLLTVTKHPSLSLVGGCRGGRIHGEPNIPHVHIVSKVMWNNADRHSHPSPHMTSAEASRDLEMPHLPSYNEDPSSHTCHLGPGRGPGLLSASGSNKAESLPSLVD